MTGPPMSGTFPQGIPGLPGNPQPPLVNQQQPQAPQPQWPQQASQQPPQPQTTPFAQQGYQVQPQAPQQSTITPPGPQAVPNPPPGWPGNNGQYGSPQAQSQPSGQTGLPGQPMGSQTPSPQRATLGDDVVLDGPSVPPELRGRTWGQAKALYTALADSYVQTNMNRPQGGQNPAMGQPVAQQPAPQPQPAQQPRDRSFWSNPEQFVKEAVQEVVSPLIQSNVSQQVMQARHTASSMIPDYTQIAPHIDRALQGIDPRNLTDPAIWVNAANLVRGQLVVSGQYQQQGNGNRGPLSPPSNPANQPPAAHTFFSEGATPSVGMGSGLNRPNLSPEQMKVAQQVVTSAFNGDWDKYWAWHGGVRTNG